MSTHDELLDAVKHVRDRTGDPNAWQTGLAPSEVVAVLSPATGPERLDAILSKIRRQHSDLFDGGPPGVRPASPPVDVPAASSDRETGNAADAIAQAEAALAHQNSASSQLDLQVTAAILNAHLKAVEGREALTKLQQETEAAVQARSDLDTPAGARDFQRFLIGKLRDIRAVVMNASLDDTSKSALMAAWTSLYDASKGGPDNPGEQASAVPVAAPAREASQQPTDNLDTGWDPLLDSALADDPEPLAADPSGQGPAGAVTPSAATTPLATPTIPDFGTGSVPGLGSMAGWGAPGGLPLSGLAGDGADPALRDLGDEGRGSRDRDPGDDTSAETDDKDAEDASVDKTEPPPPGPTVVALPDGDTVTAASPQLAAAIKAAVGGAPIAEAFHQQGITIPAPGTAVENPIDPQQLAPGDIGIFTDRHTLALGHRKALLDGQIQDIATVSGPSFLGWEHPPTATTIAPAKPDTPAPTRPATGLTT